MKFVKTSCIENSTGRTPGCLSKYKTVNTTNLPPRDKRYPGLELNTLDIGSYSGTKKRSSDLS